MAIENYLVTPAGAVPQQPSAAILDDPRAGLKIGAGIFALGSLLVVASQGWSLDKSLAVILMIGVFSGAIGQAISEHQRKARNVIPLNLLSGIEGETRVLSHLRRLPDSFALFNQLHILNPRSRTGLTECDLVVVSPAGVHLIEVKNHRGVIEGGAEQAPEWTLARDRGRESMRNPVRQAGIQARVVRAYLRERGVHVPVHPLVVLSNPQSSWRPGGTYSVPVVHLRDQAPGDLIALGHHSEQIGEDQWRQAIAALAALRVRIDASERISI